MYKREELIEQLEETYAEMADLIQNLTHLIRYIPDRTMQERARSMMLSHFQMALNNDHMWLGGNMYTFEELLADLKDPGNFEEEGDEEIKEMAPLVGAAAGLIGRGLVIGGAEAIGKTVMEPVIDKYKEWKAKDADQEDSEEEINEAPGQQSFLITGNNLLANIGCEDTANAFVDFLNSKGIEAYIHPVGSAIVRDVLALRTEEMSARLQELMAEFAQSEFNPMR